MIWLAYSAPAFANIPAVVNIAINGQNYQVTELLEHHKSFFNKDPEMWRYKLLDSQYTLVIHKKDYEANKKMLKYVPDYRDFYTKHPRLQKFMLGADAASLVLNILQVVRI
jgi:hypothetical protein